MTTSNAPISLGAPITLGGDLSEGTFSGPGVIWGVFNPSLAGPGLHTITYTMPSQCGGQPLTQTRTIFVADIEYNFVHYNLGTVVP